MKHTAAAPQKPAKLFRGVRQHHWGFLTTVLAHRGGGGHVPLDREGEKMEAGENRPNERVLDGADTHYLFMRLGEYGPSWPYSSASCRALLGEYKPFDSTRPGNSTTPG
ncbi:hypothetical protein KSP40_PGU007079 [Platanthera guangdongensis]|uniref:Uncharacterized protein n=1 Tax=Platanthera guangdongensis TaxID=2320717 RepID=A0ABR2MFU0_9ASPA